MTDRHPAADPASGQDGSYPRPQLVRPAWVDLGGLWGFAYDDDNVGRDQHWEDGAHFDRVITVPFPPESKASNIADTTFHPVVWYGRTITADDLLAAGLGKQGTRLRLHFGAVDYRAEVWLDGRYLGSHEGGHTPFFFDITDTTDHGAEWLLVVRAEDDPHDVAQPRGKQDWQLEPHGIWYHRTTGIWQPVWLEAVPERYVARLAWSCDLTEATVQLDLELSARPATPVTVRVQLSTTDALLADVQVRQAEPRSRTTITLPRQHNGQAYESLLWSPEHPRLIDATITVSPADLDTDSAFRDTITSYLGLRSVGWAGGHFLLNDRPCYLRAVLTQGYWPETHLAAPDAAALQAEVQLIKDLGFNTTRVHEKIEDPRFLYWADRLGVLVWEEAPSSYEFSPTAVERTNREWADTIRRDISHPSIITWVPLNESWGVQHIAHDPAQLAYAQALYHLTKALDPTRPVVTNDGWEHAGSDLWTIHDYGITEAELTANYPDRATVRETMTGVGPLGRRMQLTDPTDRGQPVIVSEFGGISYAPTNPDVAWGYLTAADADKFEQSLRGLFTGLQTSPVLAGFCYTQLTDTLQEANGLTDPYRRPKLPLERIRSIVMGDTIDLTGQRRPRQPVEQNHQLISSRTQEFDDTTSRQES